LLLPLDRGANLTTTLVIDQAVEVLFLGETGEELVFVLKNPAQQIVGHTCVERAGVVGHDINVIRLHSVPSLSSAW
jgi:hypothetical protein